MPSLGHCVSEVEPQPQDKRVCKVTGEQHAGQIPLGMLCQQRPARRLQYDKVVFECIVLDGSRIRSVD